MSFTRPCHIPQRSIWHLASGAGVLLAGYVGVLSLVRWWFF